MNVPVPFAEFVDADDDDQRVVTGHQGEAVRAGGVAVDLEDLHLARVLPGTVAPVTQKFVATLVLMLKNIL